MKEWTAGQIVAERYRVLAPLGQGGMGTVWRAEHVTLRSAVALKRIDVEIARNADVVARFLREARAAAALRSTHVVQVLDHGVDDGVPFIAMELLDGQPLSALLETQGRLSAERTIDILVQVARAVGRAHTAGIVHRDLKPDNIFLVQEDDHVVVKVLDFGIAKWTNPPAGAANVSAETRTGALLGTPYYMSPEQARGMRDVDHRADLWALAVIAFECLLGQRPFSSDSLGELVLKICTEPLPVPSQMGPVPASFDAWFARAAARNAEQRFQSAQELVAALRIALGSGERASAAGGATLPAAATGPGPARAGSTAAAASGERVSLGAALGLSTAGGSASELPIPMPRPRRSAPVLLLTAGALLAGGVLVARFGPWSKASPGVDLAAAAATALGDAAAGDPESPTGPEASGNKAPTPDAARTAGADAAPSALASPPAVAPTVAATPTPRPQKKTDTKPAAKPAAAGSSAATPAEPALATTPSAAATSAKKEGAKMFETRK